MSAEVEAVWQRPVKGDYPDPAMIGLSGLEQMRAWREGRAPIAPIVHLTEMLFEGAPSRGHASFSMPISPWFANGAGVIPGGMLAVLADAPLGNAIHTDLPAATAYTTAELSLTFLSPVHPGAGRVSGSGQLIHRSSSVGLSEAFLIDERDERLVAHGTSRCTIFPPLEPAPEPPAELPVLDQPLPGDDPDDPLRGEVRGAVLPQEEFDSRSGLEILEGYLAGRHEPPPLYYLTGLELTGAGDGEATMRLPCHPWLSTALRTVQGGFTAMLADGAMTAAAFSTVEAGTAVAPLDLKVNFLRPVHPDGRDLTATGRVVHRGRTLAILTARVENADGKVVALATGSAMFLPGRPASLVGVELPSATEEAERPDS